MKCVLGIRADVWALSAFAGVALYLFVRSLDILLASMFLGSVADYMRGTSQPLTLTPWLLNAVLTPLVEEYVFRRKLFEVLESRIGVTRAGLVATSLYCVVHFQYFGSLYILNVFLAGLLFQYLAFVSGSIKTSWLCHACYNTSILVPKPPLTVFTVGLGIPSADYLLVALSATLLTAYLISVVLRGLHLACGRHVLLDGFIESSSSTRGPATNMKEGGL
jgi:membrane protease YdiL (CAAX protease family)